MIPMPNHSTSLTLKWVRERLPEQSAQALATFVQVNPHWQGAQWDDCLDVLLDSDSLIEVTDPMFDALDGTDIAPIVASAVTITLWFASREFATATLTEQAEQVKAAIATGSGHAGHDAWPLLSKPGTVWCRTCQQHFTEDES